MNDSSKDGAILPLSTIVVVVAAIGGTLWYNKPLKSFRPEHSKMVLEERYDVENVNARLWQDPFQAVAEHGKVHQEGTKTEEDDAKKVDQGDHQNQDIWKKAWKEFICHARKGGSDGKVPVLCLPVMVPGGKYAENVETRLRFRYAVISGLSVRGFHPKAREHIGFIKVARANFKPEGGDEQKQQKKDTQDTLYTRGEFIVPFEWFEPNENPLQEDENKYSCVLVLWIDELSIGNQPLTQLDNIIKEIIDLSKPNLTEEERHSKSQQDEQAKAYLDVKLIGPSSSNGLLNMMRDSQKIQAPEIQDFYIYNCRATAPERLLLDSCENEENGRTVHDWFKSKDGNPAIQYHRVVCTDDELALLLVHELYLRGVDLTDKQTHIALIGELDTFYGRAFPRTFRDVVDFVLDELGKRGFEAGSSGKNKKGEEHRKELLDQIYGRECLLKALREFSRSHASKGNSQGEYVTILQRNYMRGLDGSAPSIVEEKKDWEVRDSSEKEELKHPVGPGQLDYIRR
ncbi:MAG: hypothetical protein ABIK28_21475, partial [Planctomycetota bacterium]